MNCSQFERNRFISENMMISAALFAISTLATPAACGPAALSCASPAMPVAAYPERTMFKAKGVVGAVDRRATEDDGAPRTNLACAPHPTKSPACRHRLVRAQSEAKSSGLAPGQARADDLQ